MSKFGSTSGKLNRHLEKMDQPTEETDIGVLAVRNWVPWGRWFEDLRSSVCNVSPFCWVETHQVHALQWWYWMVLGPSRLGNFVGWVKYNRVLWMYYMVVK